MAEAANVRAPYLVAPAAGRRYPMGRMQAIFKADREETGSRYSVSEWWLDPRTRGPSVHAHADDHIFYVIAGSLSLCIGEQWIDAAAGAYAIIPGGTPHSFENRGQVATGFISFNVPGGFEAKMADIAPALAAADLAM